MRPSSSAAAPGPSTRAVHAGAAPAHPNAPVVTPLVHSATFYTEPEPTGEVRYTRYGTNPVHQALGEKLAALEAAEAALVTGSGMAACAMALLSLLEAGQHVVAARALYGGTLVLLRDELPRLGITTTFVDDDGWEAAVRPETRVLLVEVPSNPTLRVADLRPLARLARERELDLVVDATFATPINLRPLEHGATLVYHSATKYLGGHSDVTAGVVAGSALRVEAVRGRLKSFGASLDPGGAWLLERGVKTLAVRVERQNRTALALAQWLRAHPAVERVLHPGLEDHPDHAVARALMSGFGGMLSLVVRGGDEAALALLRRLELFRVAPSLGGVESLVSMPRYTSHAGVERDERHALGIADGFVRLSIGIEEEADLRADLERALAPLGS
ncbi:MAG TPA: PLP-dependent aspartate aminotransferase family protein [Longimicrobiales bacterium]|nr:PLP-dependent aspartate aminotransferase family protein [Longimicrobiales bacterium]